MTTTTFNGEVHPVADLFPMLPKEELQELADSIKQDGQLQPIVLAPSGRLLDGRNRLAACKLAKVEPVFEVYEGDEDAYAMRVNFARRHLTKGQRAMIAAQCKMVVTTQSKLAEEAQTSREGVNHASTVLKFAPDLAGQVVSGALGLQDAYRTAQSRKAADERTAQILADLQEKAPDLAERVTEESLSLAEAHELSQVRARDDRERIARKVEHIHAAIAANETVDEISQLDEWPEILAALNPLTTNLTIAILERNR
jgi:ParB/RepB/Spo0J family partition protein